VSGAEEVGGTEKSACGKFAGIGTGKRASLPVGHNGEIATPPEIITFLDMREVVVDCAIRLVVAWKDNGILIAVQCGRQNSVGTKWRNLK
jgi:hypothetical protein